MHPDHIKDRLHSAIHRSPKALSNKELEEVLLVTAVITPTPNPFNQSLVAAPLLLLYFVGVLMAKLVQKPRDPAAGSAPWGPDGHRHARRLEDPWAVTGRTGRRRGG